MSETYAEAFEFNSDRSKVVIRAESYIDREDNKSRPRVEIFTSDIDGTAISNLVLKVKKAKHVREVAKMLSRLADAIDTHNKKEVYV